MLCALLFAALAPQAVVVVDAASGEPLFDAEVRAVHEASTPLAGSFWARATVRTDAQGRAELPPSTEEAPYSWTIANAVGYGFVAEFGEPSGDHTLRLELWPILPAEITLVDYRGRPLPLVHLGVAVGCGHTPDVATAVTDLAGRATLHAFGSEIDGIADVYPVGADVRLHSLDIDWPAAQQGGYVAVAEPGSHVDGRVLDADGKPLAGVAVGSPLLHRGPWTVTDERGRFRLYGTPAEHSGDLWVREFSQQADVLGVFGGSRRGVDRVLRIDPESRYDERVGLEGTLVIELAAHATDRSREDLPHVPVEVWDAATGWSDFRELRLGERYEIELRAGSYELEIGGQQSPWTPRRIHAVALEPGETSIVELTLPALHVATLRVPALAGRESVRLRSAAGADEQLGFTRVETTDRGERVGVLENWLVPSARFGLWLEPVADAPRELAHWELVDSR